ncbi:type I-E CRISPR-associated protein Cse2/CasB [Streptomyces sp. NPDC048696]|uniref:type I-E CRISPR-associated protein Cse2/CasB n=1 Tax=Streptomyces sp. NPDC048696 TaxID=3365585 RepID=UPI00371E7D05
MTTTSRPQTKTQLGAAGILVGDQIRRLQPGYLADRSEAVAVLARLRRGAGKDPLAVPDLWGLIDLGKLHDDPGLAREDDQVRAQNAVYAALTLWALHQQSRQMAMHRSGGLELGAAVRALMPGGEIDEPVRQRFVRAGSAPTLAVLAVRLRELVTLLRRDEISLDYALLADQLHRWQHIAARDDVRRSWGRSFHAHRSQQSDTSTEPPTANDGIDPKDAQ